MIVCATEVQWWHLSIDTTCLRGSFSTLAGPELGLSVSLSIELIWKFFHVALSRCFYIPGRMQRKSVSSHAETQLDSMSSVGKELQATWKWLR
jgi:hypothetical protein